ncbi:Ig-like domain-containing protein, partial [Chloroflexota bacterium]
MMRQRALEPPIEKAVTGALFCSYFDLQMVNKMKYGRLLFRVVILVLIISLLFTLMPFAAFTEKASAATPTSAIIVTVDGLDFVNTLLLTSLVGNDKYLETALEAMDLNIDHDDIIPFTWSRDAGDTEVELPRLKNLLRESYQKAVTQNKKFIVVAHSWGTYLSYMALALESMGDNPIVVDLFITLSSPLGVQYAHVVPFAPELIIVGYTYAWTLAIDFMYNLRTFPRVVKAVNFWAWGDLISGPLGYWMPLAENINVDEAHSPSNSSVNRNLLTTKYWHEYTTLQPEHPDNQALRTSVESLINDTTRDFVSPTVSDFLSGSNPNTNIIITFSEDMDASTLNDSNITIDGSSSGVHSNSFVFNPG